MEQIASGAAGQVLGAGVPASPPVSPLRRRMIQDMELSGLCQRTQESYIAAVAALQKKTGVRPDRLTEEAVYKYIMWLREESGAARGTFLRHYHGLKFFYYRCLANDWALFTRKRIRLPVKTRLPVCPFPRSGRILGGDLAVFPSESAVFGTALIRESDPAADLAAGPRRVVSLRDPADLAGVVDLARARRAAELRDC